MVVSEELSCGKVVGAPKFVPFSFSQKRKKIPLDFGSGNENGKHICFCFQNLAKKLVQDAKQICQLDSHENSSCQNKHSTSSEV